MKRNDLIRKEILLQCYAVSPLPLTAARIARDAKKNLYDYSEKEIERELQFLTDEKLLTEMPVPGVTEKHFRITSDGVRHCEQHLGFTS
jgi:hypothetical protein